jgi:hypothetical protein
MKKKLSDLAFESNNLLIENLFYYIYIFIFIPLFSGQEFWMGLDKIFMLTNSGRYKLLITMTEINSNLSYEARYESFKLENNVRNMVLCFKSF